MCPHRNELAKLCDNDLAVRLCTFSGYWCVTIEQKDISILCSRKTCEHFKCRANTDICILKNIQLYVSVIPNVPKYTFG
jgi:hypothetical protein